MVLSASNTGRTVIAPTPGHRDVTVVIDNSNRRGDNRDSKHHYDDNRGRGGRGGNIRYQERDGENS